MENIMSCTVPIPQKSNLGQGLNNLRPIAFTLHVIKCFESIILGHLSSQLSYFFDFLAEKLLHYNLHSVTIMWVLDYFSCRPQFVRLSDNLSNILKTKTGAPQGTVLSLFLFALYILDYRHKHSLCSLQ